MCDASRRAVAGLLEAATHLHAGKLLLRPLVLLPPDIPVSVFVKEGHTRTHAQGRQMHCQRTMTKDNSSYSLTHTQSHTHSHTKASVVTNARRRRQRQRQPARTHARTHARTSEQKCSASLAQWWAACASSFTEPACWRSTRFTSLRHSPFCTSLTRAIRQYSAALSSPYLSWGFGVWLDLSLIHI